MWQIIGQERAVALLRRSLKSGSLAHAYLFVGPAHVGKMTLALNLAQALNCGDTEAPCGICASCSRIASGNHADVQVIALGQGNQADSSSTTEISIEQVRQLQHSANLPPFEGKYKVFIIDGAELLSSEAANCLLKTLEEPASKVIFILLTANERRLLATVTSRCQRIELLPMSTAAIETALKKERGIEPAKARLLARLSHGCPGWAISAASNDSLLQQRTERLDELLTIVGADYETRFDYASRWVAQSSQNRRLIQDRLDLWLDWWRDLLLVKSGLSDNITNTDRLAWLNGLGKSYSLAQIRTVINGIQAAGDQLRQNANPQLALEVFMLSLPETGKSGSGKQTSQIMVN